jgi:hypothetical protein
MAQRAHKMMIAVAAFVLAAVSLAAVSFKAMPAAASPLAPARSHTAAAPLATGSDWAGETLLLVHGFSDSCQDAWQTPGGSGLPGDTTTVSYFSGIFGTIDQVGYYTRTNPDNTSDSSCSEDVQTESASPGSSACDHLADVTNGNEPTGNYGTWNDHLDRLACLLAWYIYDKYTTASPPVAVNILAHSMGGVLTQYAIGATQNHIADFPPNPLRVLRVVTVATPHAGVSGRYLNGAQQSYGSSASVELGDLASGSTFMNQLASWGKPHGTAGTYWALMGASDSAYMYKGGCPSPPSGDPLGGGNWTSCSAEQLFDPSPDGDGVVQSVSQMSMPADYKVLYGIVDNFGISITTDVADPQTQYEHEVNTPAIVGNLTAPFYLNDGRTGTTKAFVCPSNCTATSDYSDLNLSTPASVPYSLAEIASANMLEHPVVQDISGGGQFDQEWNANTSLGSPIGYSYSTAGGQEQDFQRGAIYWSAGTGTHAVYGPAYTEYGLLGGPSSVLGFPASDALAQTGGGTLWQFAGTSCTVTGIAGSGSAILLGGPTYTTGQTTPAVETQGCLYQAYEQLYGGPGGGLGYPTSDELPIGSGRVSYFTGGTSKPSCSTGTESTNGMTTAALYWNGSVHEVNGCIFAEYFALGEATGKLGFPTDNAYTWNGGHRQDFQNGYISGANGSYSVTYTGSQWVVGHAQYAGDDYPYQTLGQFDHQNAMDAWNEYYGQCDGFAAWKVYENLYGAAGNPITRPSALPAPGWTPPDASISPVNQKTMGPGGGWGNADAWAGFWSGKGYAVNHVPVPGAIAYWANATSDPQDGLAGQANGIGTFGHVGYVTDVYPDGSVTIESYNLRSNGEYSVIHLAYGQSATDTSYNQGSFTVPWPTDFIHVADGPSLDSTSPAEPGNGTVSWGYPSGPNHVVVIGPGSSSSQYSLGNTWYVQSGHGELGNEEWTHTNGATAVSTATYTPAGLAGSTCYRVDALVPDNYSDNPVAVYTVTDSAGTHLAAVNENDYTNDWAELGVFETSSSGGITVRLDDRGTTGLYVAADAMRFWRQASCGGYGDVAPILGPGAFSGTWSGDSGHGFSGTMQDAVTSGSLTSSTATAAWQPTLLPFTCYEVSAYIPDNYSDNYAARYQVQDFSYGSFWPQVNENAFTNQFTDIGGFESNASGQITVRLTNMGPSGQWVAADAMAFTPDPQCLGPAGNGIGAGYQADMEGPGSAPGNFVTTSLWYSQLGHGYSLHELWTHDNGSTADSTATWTYRGSANTSYLVCAFVPDNYADNTAASYVVTTSAGIPLSASVNQANVTNAFTKVATVTTGSDGAITVELNDTGPTGDYTAADAMEFLANATSC